MTQKTTLKTRQRSAMPASTAISATDSTHRRELLGIVDDLMDTESVLATAIVAVDADGVDPEDVQITLVIVRARLHAAMQRVNALRD
jgi:hypothetical protein